MLSRFHITRHSTLLCHTSCGANSYAFCGGLRHHVCRRPLFRRPCPHYLVRASAARQHPDQFGASLHPTLFDIFFVFRYDAAEKKPVRQQSIGAITRSFAFETQSDHVEAYSKGQKLRSDVHVTQKSKAGRYFGI